MRSILIIARREVASLFVSPVAYFVLFLFLIFMGIIFTVYVFLPSRFVEIRDLINWSRFSLFFVVPLLTMSLFSEEYSTGRIEIIRTSPISEIQLILGKFLGAMTYYLFLILCSLVYLIVMRFFGKPDWGQVLSAYIGMVFMGFMFVSVGLFYSACTREQIVAALASIITLGILVSLSYLSAQVPVTILKVPTRAITEYLAVGTHIGDFARGSIQLTNIVYFSGFSALFLFWTYVVLESKKWR